MPFSHKPYLQLGSHGGIDPRSLVEGEYELSYYRSGFNQQLDDRGKGSSEVRSEGFSVTIPSLPTTEIAAWALNSDPAKHKIGAFHFYDSDFNKARSLLFENAACISMFINYTLRGKAYLTTDLVVLPETVKMGTSSAVEHSNFWTTEDIKQNPKSSIGIPRIPKLDSLHDAEMTVELFVDGMLYPLEKLQMGFIQEVDHKGQPQTETKGGQIAITISQFADDNICRWMLKPNIVKTGSILFKTPTSGTVMEAVFENAYCVGHSEEVNPLSTTGTRTQLLLAPEYVKIYNITHNNRWRSKP